MTRRRRRRSLARPEAIEDVLARAGEDRFALHRPPVSSRIWAEAVGARIAERARPITLERGVLTVRAATSVWAATSPTLDGLGGVYCEDCDVAAPYDGENRRGVAAWATDPAQASRLWDLSVSLTGSDLGTGR